MNVSSALQVGKTDSFEEERAALRKAFLKREGLENEPLVPLLADASKRRYFRLPNALLMDAPPPHESTVSFQVKADLLRAAGLTTPLIYAAEHAQGFLLIEDLGDLPYRKALQSGISEKLLYGETVRALSYLHQGMPDNNSGFPTYDVETFLREVNVFIEWYGLPLSEKAKANFKEVWKEVYQNQPVLPQSFVLRDVMVDNLLWLPLRQGVNRCGFIDFQDGLWGPTSYDLVSLLEDARRDIPPSFAKEMVGIYLEAFPDLLRDEVEASYFLWGAQRSTRILGVFSRLAKRDGKPHYLPHLPRVWDYLKQDLQHPSLKSVKQWFEAYAGAGRG